MYILLLCICAKVINLVQQKMFLCGVISPDYNFLTHLDSCLNSLSFKTVAFLFFRMKVARVSIYAQHIHKYREKTIL